MIYLANVMSESDRGPVQDHRIDSWENPDTPPLRERWGPTASSAGSVAAAWGSARAPGGGRGAAPGRRYLNIMTACGFSGHGVMHAPAVGRALTELVLDGGYQNLDLSRLGFERVLNGEPYPEVGIK